MAQLQLANLRKSFGQVQVIKEQAGTFSDSIKLWV